MQAMLDREMPVERRRRFIWWWWSLLLLPLALYGSWQWFHSEQNPSSPVKEINTALPIASSNSKSSTLPENLPVVQTQSSTQHTSAIEIRSAVAPNKQAYLAQTTLSSTVGSDIPSVGFVQTEPTPSSNSQTHHEGEMPVKNLFDLHTIPPYPLGLQQQTSFINPSKPFAQIQKPVKKPMARKWAMGATSALATEQFSTINGFSTGLTVDWKFARKWGIRTGAFYNIHTPQEEYRPVASVQSSDYTANVDGSVIVVDAVTGTEVVNGLGTNYYGDSLGGSVFIPVNRLQRVEVPVSAFWQASRPLKIFAGVSFARTFSTTADRQNYSGDYILRLADKVAEDDASELSSSELDNWSADAMLGAGYKLGKSFELGFSAKMPFNDFKSLKKASYSPSFNNGITDEVGRTRAKGTPVFSLYGTLFF